MPWQVAGKTGDGCGVQAMASLTEAMEHTKLTKGEVSTEETPSGLSDGEHHRGERFAIYFEVEK